jgi:hypothetical protein
MNAGTQESRPVSPHHRVVIVPSRFDVQSFTVGDAFSAVSAGRRSFGRGLNIIATVYSRVLACFFSSVQSARYSPL